MILALFLQQKGRLGACGGAELSILNFSSQIEEDRRLLIGHEKSAEIFVAENWEALIGEQMIEGE